MRALCCMTAATMLVAGVSARADLVRTFNVSGTFTYSIRVSDPVVVDAMTSAPEFANALSWPMDATEFGSCAASGKRDSRSGAVERGAAGDSAARICGDDAQAISRLVRFFLLV
jgi:hypothetical protein